MQCHPSMNLHDNSPCQERIIHLFNHLRALVDDDHKAEELIRIKINSHTESAIATEDNFSDWVSKHESLAEMACTYALLEVLVDQHKSMRKTLSQLYLDIKELKK